MNTLNKNITNEKINNDYLIKIKNVNKYFGPHKVLKNINLKIKKNEILTIIGHSGSGKSTLLRCLNLLEKPYSGEIWIKKQNILEPDTKLSELRTKVGMVFQSFNLFEEKTILENCCLAPIKILKISEEQAKKTAIEKLREVGLSHLANKNVNFLSGGQKQRVAIARALCMFPEILLLDEPTSALDPDASYEVLKILNNLAKNCDMTLIIVTHEMKFAKKVSHNICFMEKGIIIEKGPSKEVFTTNNFPKIKSFFEDL
ncbi:ABC-type amino acid transport system ATP-binding protein [Candidatus Phytoplasma luffae]|uniref:ABC-type amino acid transport system ATP-binding protein n=1 Tax=Loofah witches'-broom phytoplasma TaxID=35773 RepID=A0A975FJM7_LOWBP|nr:amino acid ABC transporter ATP-binding protein [Candidatus Phytoplasma luffae]QTX03235.1 ABC-type amino acid transport system ATP-binding protein [Candidatus Phytoplasma luffae]